MSTMHARIAPLSGAEPSTNGWATRVTLQPIAAPSALGLAGFSVATLMVATIQAKWWGSPADFKGVAPFCLTFGDFVAPTLVGGPSATMIATVIQSQFGIALNWPLGAALSIVVLVIVLTIISLSDRFERTGRLNLG